MDTLSIDNDIARKLNQGMASGEAIMLPFPVIYLWVINGTPSYKSQGGALYFGGWACKADELNSVGEIAGVSAPKGWSPVTVGTREGEEYDAYTTRHVIVAPIGKRTSWLFDGKRYPEYIEGGRRHIQVLAYLAEKNGKYKAWGPVVLTAKGYQARFLLEAFSKWQKAIEKPRQKIAKTVPPWCFYLAVGTFSKERQGLNVGQPGSQSPITPISVYIPDELKEEQLAGLFVGSEIAAVMADLQDQAADWLNAWKSPAIEQPAASDGNSLDPWTDEVPF